MCDEKKLRDRRAILSGVFKNEPLEFWRKLPRPDALMGVSESGEERQCLGDL